MQSTIDKARSGDRAAIEALCKEQREFVTRLVIRFLGHGSDVEDVVQEVFVQVHKSLPNFRGDSKFTTWLYTLTTNVTRMHLRKKRSRVELVTGLDQDGEDASPSAQEWVEVSERVAAFYRILERIAEKKRVVFVLHDIEGVSAAQISEIVDAPILTVRTRLFYARKELYALLREEPTLSALVQDFLSAQTAGKP